MFSYFACGEYRKTPTSTGSRRNCSFVFFLFTDGYPYGEKQSCVSVSPREHVFLTLMQPIF